MQAQTGCHSGEGLDSRAQGQRGPLSSGTAENGGASGVGRAAGSPGRSRENGGGLGWKDFHRPGLHGGRGQTLLKAGGNDSTLVGRGGPDSWPRTQQGRWRAADRRGEGSGAHSSASSKDLVAFLI